MRRIALIACFAIALSLMAACGSEESIPKSASTVVSPESSPQAQQMPAGPDQDAAILRKAATSTWLCGLRKAAGGPRLSVTRPPSTAGS